MRRILKKTSHSQKKRKPFVKVRKLGERLLALLRGFAEFFRNFLIASRQFVGFGGQLLLGNEERAVRRLQRLQFLLTAGVARLQHHLQFCNLLLETPHSFARGCRCGRIRAAAEGEARLEGEVAAIVAGERKVRGVKVIGDIGKERKLKRCRRKTCDPEENINILIFLLNIFIITYYGHYNTILLLFIYTITEIYLFLYLWNSMYFKYFIAP